MSRRGWILFALLSVAWGLPYLLIKVAVAEVSVPVLVFARVTLGVAILLPLALRGGRMLQLGRFWRPLTAFATLEFIVPWGLLSHAETRLTSSTAGLLMASIPIIAVVLVKLTGDAERLGRRRSAGLALGFAGVFVLAAPELGGDRWSVAEVMLAAVCYAAAAIVAARGLKDVPALPMTTVCLALAALVYLPAAVATWPTEAPSLEVSAAITALAVVCTALAFIWFFALIREVGVTRALVVTYVNPVVAVAAGVVVLSEPFSVSILISSALILSGTILATARGVANGGSPHMASDVRR